MTILWFSLVGVMAVLSWRHARSQFSPVAAAGSGRLGRGSSVVGNRDAAAGAETPSVRVTRDTRTEGSNPEPAHAGLGQMSRAEGEAARDAVPAPPGRAAGVHVFDLRGPQPQGVAS